MNKLRMYLMGAIILVGLIPVPNQFPWETPEGCKHYNSLFVSVRWKWEGCGIVPSDTIAVYIPGQLMETNARSIDEVVPSILILYLDGYVWGSVSQPPLWREESWKLPQLLFQLYPKINLEWAEELANGTE